MPKRDKRERLVQAAARVYHRQGYSASTLADVATESGVPLGNIYYYFRTKDDLARAVVATRLGELRQMMSEAEASTDDPRGQLARYLKNFVDTAEEITRHGCPYTCLAQELERREGPLRGESGALVAEQLEWIRGRYRAMGQSPAAAAASADNLLEGWQGATVLAQALHDPTKLRAAYERLFG